MFNGTIQVAVDGTGAIHSLRASDVPPAVTGRFVLDEAAAARAALAGFGGSARWTGTPNVRRGWYAMTTQTRPAFQVEQATANPPGAWRVTVDAETGRILFRQNRRLHAAGDGRVYELSPVERGVGVLCPMASGKYTLCAAPIDVKPLPNLNGDRTSLAGSQAGPVYQCNGAAFPETAEEFKNCTPIASATGDYAFTPDGSQQASTTDEFAGVMAYYQLDRHVTFLKRLAGSDLDAVAALVAIPVFVNAYELKQTSPPSLEPYANAHFDPLAKAIVFGQAPGVDLAYDASVAFHERNHAAFEQLVPGAFPIGLDAKGAAMEPMALNEGSADVLAAAHTGSSKLGFYAGNRLAALPFLRDVDNVKTCKGTGAKTSQLGRMAVDGMNGESHDDGEIWSGFSWELTKALQGATTACGESSCPSAAAAIQFQAAQLAAGREASTYQSYAEDLATAAGLVLTDAALLSQARTAIQAAVTSHKLDECDREFPLYAGETKLQYIGYRYGSFQLKVTTTGPAMLRVCSFSGLPGTAWLRKDAPVTLVNPAITGDTDASGSLAVSLTTQCTALGQVDQVAISEAGTWYVLFDVPGADGTNGVEGLVVRAGTTGIASRPGGSAMNEGPGAGGGSTSSGGCGIGGGGLSLLALAPLLLAGRRRARS